MKKSMKVLLLAVAMATKVEVKSKDVGTIFGQGVMVIGGVTFSTLISVGVIGGFCNWLAQKKPLCMFSAYKEMQPLSYLKNKPTLHTVLGIIPVVAGGYIFRKTLLRLLDSIVK